MLLARKKPDNAPDFALQERFRDTFGRRVRIRLLGLFAARAQDSARRHDPPFGPHAPGRRHRLRLPNTPRRMHVAADAPLGASAATARARAA